MLVLRRKAGEAIVLNGVITIYGLAVEGERVKLGISAPPEVVIVRSELLDAPAGGPGGPGGAVGGPAGAPVTGRPSGGPVVESNPDYGRAPRAPERPYRQDERPYREPEPPMRTTDGSGPDRSGSFNAPARYTPRRRYDNFGEDSSAPVITSHDISRYR